MMTAIQATVCRPRSISKYGAVSEPPRDDSVFYVGDDNFGMFAAVRVLLFLH